MLLSLFLSSVAWPCAALFVPEGQLAATDAQEAIFRLVGDSVEVEYNVKYEGTAADFGWVIPTFGAFESLEEADPALFDSYRDTTQPLVNGYDSSTDGGCGCSSDKSDGALDTGGDIGAVVVAEGFTGNYEYVVIEGNAAEVYSWLDDNGWSTGTSTAAISGYDSIPSVQFVCLKLAPTSSSTPDGGRTLVPVKIRYKGDTLRFPAIMAYYGMPETVRTTIWVEGGVRATVAEGWSQVEIATVAAEPYDFPEDVWDAALWDATGETATYAVTYAGETQSGGWLTRFDTWAAREVHLDDPVFEINGGTTSLHAEVVYPSESAGGPAWLLVPLLGFGGMLRRRRASL